MDILSNFGETLSELMLIDNLKAKNLSEQISIDRSTITRYLEKKMIPTLPYAIELADYFGCSLDYLFGLLNEYEKKTYLSTPPFSQVFQEALKSRQLTRYKLNKDLGFHNNTLGDWFKGKRTPNIDNLIVLANYFGCTLDEVVGRKAAN